MPVNCCCQLFKLEILEFNCERNLGQIVLVICNSNCYRHIYNNVRVINLGNM